MLTAYSFLAIVFTGYLLALIRGPFWGLLVYAYVYLMSPVQSLNWWAGYLPFTRWSLITSAVLVMSFIIHKDKIVNRKFLSANWLFSFFLLTFLISLFRDSRQPDMLDHTYMLFTYCVTVYIIIRSLEKPDQYRIFLFVIFILVAYLSVKAWRYGNLEHGRLENFGTSDTAESNHFAVFLVSIVPFALPFIFYGKLYEKILCTLALPFLFNVFFMCNSRGGLVAMILSISYGFFFSTKRFRKIILIGVMCGFALSLYLANESYIERASTLWKSERQSVADLNTLSTGRVDIWKYGFEMAKDNPFGIGPNGFKHLAHLYMPEEVLKFRPGAEKGLRAAHNTYLQALVEQGFLGLFIWLGLCYSTLKLLRKSAKKLQQLNMSDSFTGLTIVALNMSLIATMVGGLFASRIYYEFFWWQVAMCVVAYSFVLDIENEVKN